MKYVNHTFNLLYRIDYIHFLNCATDSVSFTIHSQLITMMIIMMMKMKMILLFFIHSFL